MTNLFSLEKVTYMSADMPLNVPQKYNKDKDTLIYRR